MDFTAAIATLWCALVLLRYRSLRHPKSSSLLIVIAAMVFYSLGTAIPFVHINWYLPDISGSFPEGQLLYQVHIHAFKKG